MKNNKTKITGSEFDRQESFNKKRKGSLFINGVQYYGFFTEGFFFFTVGDCFYRVKISIPYFEKSKGLGR